MPWPKKPWNANANDLRLDTVQMRCGAKSSLNTAFCRSNKVQWLFESFNWYLCTHLNDYLSASPHTPTHTRTHAHPHATQLRPQTIHQWLQIPNDLRRAELETSLASFPLKWSVRLAGDFYLQNSFCASSVHTARGMSERQRERGRQTVQSWVLSYQ